MFEPDLQGFFEPRRVALVGASERSGWTRLVLAGLRKEGAPHCELVNPRSGDVYGRGTWPSLSEVPKPIDLAFIMVAPTLVADIVEEGMRSGIRDFVVLSSGPTGMTEQGSADLARLRAMVAMGARILGPNVSGFVNATKAVRLFGLPVPAGLPVGGLGVVMQSGGLATHALSLSRSWGIGISALVATGNEAFMSAVNVIDYLSSDSATRVIALFLESVRDPDAFATAVRRATGAGKPVIALHVGSSTLGRAAAYSHTGALVGDHATTMAALESLGVVTVDSMEELIATAGMLAAFPEGIAGSRLAVVAASGGACELIADAADRLGLTLPAFSSALTDALAEEMPASAEIQNPLDVTGLVVKSGELPFRATALISSVAPDDYDAVVLQSVVFPEAATGDDAQVRQRFAALAATVRQSAVPVVLQTGATYSLSPFALELVTGNGLTILPGIATGVRAVERAVHYRRLMEGASGEVPAEIGGPPLDHEVRTRGQVVATLELAGLCMPYARLATSADEAVAAADVNGYSVVLKVVSDDIMHKSDVGGVVLGLQDATQVRAAYSSILRSVGAAVPSARIDGISVEPMRPAGTELLVGIVIHRSWGPVLTLGSGGVLAEVLEDVSVRVGWQSPEGVSEMLSTLRIARLLDGYRGQPRTDRSRLVDAVMAIQRTAALLGPELSTLEVNPLWVLGEQIEALDLLVEWATE